MFLKPTTHKLKPDRRGFTLIEIIVVVAITALLTAVLVGYSRRSRSQILLNTEKAKIAQTILQVKSSALAGFTKPPTNPPPCSYGLYFDYAEETYSFFEYLPPPPAGCGDVFTSPIDNSNPAYFRVISTLKQSLSPELDFDNGPNRLGFVIFVPPEPKVVLYQEDGSVFLEPMTIYLKTRDGSLTTAITVNPITGQLSL